MGLLEIRPSTPSAPLNPILSELKIINYQKSAIHKLFHLNYKYNIKNIRRLMILFFIFPKINNANIFLSITRRSLYPSLFTVMCISLFNFTLDIIISILTFYSLKNNIII